MLTQLNIVDLKFGVFRHVQIVPSDWDLLHYVWDG